MSPTVNSLKELHVPSPFSNSILAMRGRAVSRILKGEEQIVKMAHDRNVSVDRQSSKYIYREV